MAEKSIPVETAEKADALVPYEIGKSPLTATKKIATKKTVTRKKVGGKKKEAPASVEELLGKKALKTRGEKEVKTRYMIIGVSVAMAIILLIIGFSINYEVCPECGERLEPSDYEATYGGPTEYCPNSNCDEKIKERPDKTIGSLDTLSFVMLAIMVGVGPISFWEGKRVKRIINIEERLSDFLRDLAEAGRSGQTLHDAIRTARRNDYGELTPEIHIMARQISWGLSATDSLSRFANRVDTPLVQRAVILINQASAAGGDIATVLEAAASDTKEMQLLQQERQMEMSGYVMVIFVSFIVFLIVILIVYITFLPQMKKMAEDMVESEEEGEGSGAMGGAFNPTNVDFKEIRMIYIMAGLIQGFGSGLLAGIFGSGRMTDGLKHSVTMVAIVFVIFTFIMP